MLAALERARYRFIPDHVVGEILSKRWIDNAIPFAVLVIVLTSFGLLLPDSYNAANLAISGRQLGEVGLVCLAMMVVIISGGIDLSVGSNFALGNFLTLALLTLAGWPLELVIPVVILACGTIGLFNGILVGYLKLRAFLTTLVTLIIVRAAVDLLLLKYAQPISMVFYDNEAWTYLGLGGPYGIPTSFCVFVVVALIGHVLLTRSSIGWRVMAIGGSRKSAHNIGIAVKRTLCGTYVVSGMLCGLASVLYAARLGGAGTDTGNGLEPARTQVTEIIADLRRESVLASASEPRQLDENDSRHVRRRSFAPSYRPAESSS